MCIHIWTRPPQQSTTTKFHFVWVYNVYLWCKYISVRAFSVFIGDIFGRPSSCINIVQKWLKWLPNGNFIVQRRPNSLPTANWNGIRCGALDAITPFTFNLRTDDANFGTLLPPEQLSPAQMIDFLSVFLAFPFFSAFFFFGLVCSDTRANYFLIIIYLGRCHIP